MARILIIDDEEAVRALLRTALKSEGHEVAEAASGTEGVNLYRARRVDLVLTDMFMPGGGGLGCILELRRIDPHVRIIAMSGGGPSVDLLETASHFGADRTLTKPFQVADAVAAIRAELKSNKAA